MSKIGFDNEKYIALQSQYIRERIEKFDNKLYLEFGGKLFDDYHASRVLPGFAPDTKIKMLVQLRGQAEIIIVINASDIEKNKVRGDLGITYDLEVLRLIDSFREIDLYVGSVVIAQYTEQSAAKEFIHKMRQVGIKVYRHYPISGYPSNIAHIVSDAGFGKNEYIQTTRPLVIVTAPGPGSGKMATCLSQLYHEYKRGVKAGYAKFETFPIWNLPIQHPVNLAYEAATVDLNDVNMIDPFHLETYGKTAINYNRDVEIFPVLNAILEKISGVSPYRSPTDMGVNMVGNCILDDTIVRDAAKQEIIRRYYYCLCEQKQGKCDAESVYKIELLMNQAGISLRDRMVVQPSLETSDSTGTPVTAIQLPDDTIVTGKTSDLLGASSAAILNALKKLANIPDEIHLVSPQTIAPIQTLKINHFGNSNPRLHTDETLIALSISAATNKVAKLALEQLHKLKGCEAHSSVILSQVDESIFRRLGVNITCEPRYQTNKLYHK